MDAALFITFFVVSVGLIVIPGPNVLVIVSTSIGHGKSRGLQTVAGTTSAMAIQLIIAVAGTAWFVQLLADGFYILKWLGVGYLLYLSLLHFRQACFGRHTPIALTASGTFARGFFVSISNPKTIVFFTAFLPQFVTPDGNYIQQTFILSMTFLSLAAALDSCYAILAASLQPLLERCNHSRVQSGISGILFFATSAWLATMRRAQ